LHDYVTSPAEQESRRLVAALEAGNIRARTSGAGPNLARSENLPGLHIFRVVPY